MKLYLLRHGIAEPKDGSQPDEERELTRRGRERLLASMDGLRRLEIRPSAVLSSALPRALQTAELAREALAPASALELIDELMPDAPPESLRPVLQRYTAVESLMLVGHEPQFSQLILHLCGAEGGEVVIKKGGLCRIDLDDPAGQGRLVWLLAPRVMRALSGSSD